MLALLVAVGPHASCKPPSPLLDGSRAAPELYWTCWWQLDSGKLLVAPKEKGVEPVISQEGALTCRDMVSVVI